MKRRMTIGPGAASLILLILVLSMSTLGVLSLMNARNDLSLSRRSLRVAEEIYQLNDMAERSAARLDEVLAQCAASADTDEGYLTLIARSLPDGVQLSGHDVTWQEQDAAGRSLYCRMAIAPLGSQPRTAWRAHELMSETKEMGYDDGWN